MAKTLICFYCDAPVVKRGYERDHFPVPKSCGGTETVIACLTCHNLKDRIRFDDWRGE